MKNKGNYKYTSKEAVIDAAKSFINEKCFGSYSKSSVSFSDPETAGEFLLLNHEQTESETFSVAFLNSKNKLICHETLFTGSINSAQVYPRTVALYSLKHNAAAVILAHHHPSGDTEPSQSDIVLTKRLKQSLDLIDVKVLDHFILGGDRYRSMASLQLI